MLPHASDLGISESFGTSTIANIDVKLDKDANHSINFNFPTDISSNVGHRLQFIRKSTKKIWDPALELKFIGQEEQESKRSQYIVGSSKFMLESTDEKILKTTLDPTVHNTTAIIKLQDKNIIATNLGRYNNVLAIGFVDDITQKLNKQSTTQHKPLKFTSLKSLTFPDEIQQIQSNIVDDSTSLFLVRTSQSVYVLKFYFNKTFKLSKLFHFEKTEKWAFLSHASLLVTGNKLMIAIVDCVGKFSVFRGDRSSKKITFAKLNLNFHSFYDPVDLSNYKKTEWINEHRLILLSRFQLHEYRINHRNYDQMDGSENFNEDEDDVKPEKLFCRICSGTWSRLLDLVRSAIDPKYFYLLTTKEIIIIDVSLGFKRCVAWKHFFNESDTSMSLQTIIMKDTEIVIVSSKKSNLSFVLDFSLNQMKLINHPYLLIPYTSTPVISLGFHRLGTPDQLLCIQKLSTSTVVVSKIEYKQLEDNRIIRHRNLHIETNEIIKPDCLFSLDIQSLYQTINNSEIQPIDSSPQATEITVEIYKKLENYLERSTLTFSSLFQLIGSIHIPRNIKNTFKIVQHIIRNDKNQQLSIRLLNNQWYCDTNINYHLESDDDISLQSDNILKFFKSINNGETSPDIILNLMLSLIGVWKTYKSLDDAMIEEELDDSVADLPKNYQEMVKSFQDDFNAIGIMDSEEEEKGYTSTDPYMGSLLSMPSVSVSQTPPVIGTSQLVHPKVRQKSNGKSKSKFIPKTTITTVKKSESRGTTPMSSQLNILESQSQGNSRLLSQTTSQPKTSVPLSQKMSQQPSFGFSQSQSKGPRKKKRKTGF